MRRKKKKLWSLLNKTLLSHVTIPVLSVVLGGLICVIILRLGSGIRATAPIAGDSADTPRKVLALYIEEPPEWAKDNAAFYYQKAFNRVLELFKSDRAGLTDAELLKLAQPVLDLFAQGARLSKCDFSYEGKRKGVPVSFRSAISKVYLCEIVLRKADHLFSIGKTEEAIGLYRMFFKYLTHLSDQKNVTCAVELVQDKKMIFERLKPLVESGTLTSGQIKGLLSLLEEYDRNETPFSRAVLALAQRQEKLFETLPPELYSRYAGVVNGYFCRLTEGLDRKDSGALALANVSRVSLAGYDARLVTLAEGIKKNSSIDKKLLSNLVSQHRKGRLYGDLAEILFAISCPDFDALYSDYFLSCAEWDLLKSGLAVRLFRAEHKVFPYDMAELVPGYLNREPRDPFGSDTFVLKNDGQRLVIASVGEIKGREGRLEIVVE